MQIPLQINFDGMEPSPAVEARIREKAAKLERFYDRIVGCRVRCRGAPPSPASRQALQCAHRNQRSGEAPPSRAHRTGNHAHEDVYVAMRDAFNAAVHLLEGHAQRMRGEVKIHSER
jgi:ribosome-associated translation inhibitor RaiA